MRIGERCWLLRENKFILGGEMSADTMEPYHETSVDIPGRVESVQLDDDLEWCRDDIDVDKVEVIDQLDVMINLKPIAYDH